MNGDQTWHLIAARPDELNFAANNIAVVQLAGKKICIARHHDQLFAFAYTCPHAGGIMANGNIDALGNIVCPLHHYKFKMSNGLNVTGEGYRLKTYTVKVDSEGIQIQVSH